MSSKEQLLRALTVKKLRELAKENKVLLVTEEGLFWGGTKATRKDDIIEILSASRKVSKKEIEAKVFGPTKKKTTAKRKSAKVAKPKRRGLAKAEKTIILKRQKYKCAKCRRARARETFLSLDMPRKPNEASMSFRIDSIFHPYLGKKIKIRVEELSE